ncbi:MAG: SPASM domain-containing protein, partial [Candidatus Heimdallarchaeota archaeon]|nr:SPASM domain-containing protein [Candidatus Heimdallarchaeota archaeon]MCK4876180.1 SPASM domain-containing protein [Candidatus Heimdallarchaeota archaeon]
MGKMRGELFYYKTISEKMILDPTSQLIWKLNGNLKSLEKIDEGKYPLLDFCKLIEEIDDDEARIFHTGLTKLNSYGFFQDKETEMKQISSKDFHNIVINPTTTCNLDCWYCYSREFRKTNTEELGLEEIKKTILYFADRKTEYHSETSLSISLFYLSEVTLNFHMFLKIKEFIEKIKHNYDFDIFLFPPPTNLLEIDQSFVDYINEYGFLTVSVDYTNTNQIQKIMRNVKTFDDNITKHCIVPLHSRMNNLIGVYKSFMEVFDYVSLRPVRVGENSKFPWGTESLQIFDNELNMLCNQLFELEDEELVSFLLSLGPSDYFSRYMQRVISRNKLFNRCSAGIEALAVGPDSKFYPCSGFVGRENFVLGTTKTGVNIDLISKYQSSVNSNTLCADCPIKYYCGGFCEDWKQMMGKKQESLQIECNINQVFFKN